MARARANLAEWTTYALVGAAVAAGAYAVSNWLATRCKVLVKPGTKLLVVGDSLSVGLNRYFPKVLPAGVQYFPFVKGGTAMFQWMGNKSYGIAFREGVKQVKPDVVVVVLGTNDSHPWTSGVWPKLEQDVDRVLAFIRENGAQPFWVLPPLLPFDEKVAPIVRRKGVPVFESTQYPIRQLSDKIHATPEGYEYWAKEVVKVLTCTVDK